MDERSRKYLDSILAKSPSELTPDELAFVIARSSYLKEYQINEYIIKNQTPKQDGKKKHARKKTTAL